MEASNRTMAAAPSLSELAERLYAPGEFTRKASSYLAEYERIFAGRRHEKLRILELGVSSGASMMLWRDYLPHATIVGLDIDPMPDVLAGLDRIHILRASQDDIAALDQAMALAGGPFDVIVDDASHLGYLTKRSFLHLFPHCLKPGGTYVIEDFGTGFMPEYPDGQEYRDPPWNDAEPDATVFASHQHGMVGVVKQLADPMMQQLITGQRSFLAIERLTIIANLAIVQKSMEPAGPMPPALVRPPPRVEAIERELRLLTRRVAEQEEAVAAEIALLHDRVAELEVVLGNVVAPLQPFRRIWRGLTGKSA